MILSFDQYSSKPELNENVSTAKAFLLKTAAEARKRKMKLDPTEKITFTPEEEKDILNNPDYIEVRDYFLNVVKKPGLVYPFTYFRIAEKLPFSGGGVTVESLNRKLDEVNPMLSTFPLPLGNVEGYVKKKLTSPGEDPRPSYEMLSDDIDVILSQKKVKEFVDNFVGPIRQEYSKSLKLKNEDAERANLLDRLYHAVSDIKNLKPIYNEKTGKEETAEEQLIKHASTYKDVRSNPSYKDTYVAFKGFLRDCEDKVESWGSDINDFIEELKEIAPSIKILYFDPKSKIVVTSARSGEGMRSVCKIANATLCIRDNDTFWRYTSGKLQISISLLYLPKTDDKYLTSFTVDANGRLTDSANRRNSSQHRSSENYIDFLQRYLGDIDLVNIEDVIRKNFQTELTIKKIVESIERRSGKKDNKSLIYALGTIGIQKAVEEGEYSQDEMDIFKNLIITIIKKDNNISYQEIVQAFMDEKNGGFFTMEDVQLFEELSERNYNKEDVKAIMELTEAAQPALEGFLNQLAGKDDKLYKMVKFILDSYPSIKNYVESRML